MGPALILGELRIIRGVEIIITRREFIKKSALAAGGTALLGNLFMCKGSRKLAEKSRIVSTAAEDMLNAQKSNPEAVHRAFSADYNTVSGSNWGGTEIFCFWGQKIDCPFLKGIG